MKSIHYFSFTFSLTILFLLILNNATGISAQKTLSYLVAEKYGLLFTSQNPVIDIIVFNKGNDAVSDHINLNLSRDTGEKLEIYSKSITVPANDSSIVSFSFSVDPGFYRIILSSDSGTFKKFNIGYKPEMIVSPSDAQSDLKEFWDKAQEELASVKPEYELEFLKDSSNERRRIYLVKMKSIGNVEISGYYARPVKQGKFPAIISYMGYGSKPWCPKPDNNPEFVEFVLSVRGQALQESKNIYGEWVTYNLQDEKKFYYRGAFMDLIRAVDFIESRHEVDKKFIFAEGGSQGGAFTLAACALDNRICAAAPFIPFLSDYPDYFKIVRWPAVSILAKQKELGITDSLLFKTLSYFDIKNLAGWINNPIIMGFGLQDEVCPPHTNFAGYNLITSEKSYVCYSDKGHDVGSDWWKKRMDFFKRFIKDNSK